MPWKRGPMPVGTYGWGGVVPRDHPHQYGFFFADFTGDSVIVQQGKGSENRILQPHEVAFYDNSIQLPIRVDGWECCSDIKGRAET